MAEKQERPVLTGLTALVAVAAVVGLLLGVVALVGTQILGLGGDKTTTGTATGGDSLYLPAPQETSEDASGKITLAPGDPTSSSTQSPEATKKPEREIKLSSGKTRVASFGQIDLSGSYPRGEGSILQVQRFENGKWVGFYSVSVTVSGGSFSTFVQTSRSGANKFRVIDTDTDTTSNAVSVRVG
jgi:hypothetical protein